MWLLVCLVILVMWLLYSLVRQLKYLGKRPRLKSIGITVFLFFAIALVNAAINPPNVQPVYIEPKTTKVPTTTTVVPPPAAIRRSFMVFIVFYLPLLQNAITCNCILQ